MDISRIRNYVSHRVSEIYRDNRSFIVRAVNIIREHLAITFAILVALVISLVIVWKKPEIGINLLSELVGVMFTVYVIDNLLKARDRKKLRPVIRAAAKDLSEIYRKCLSLIMYALDQAATPSDGSTLAEIGDTFGKANIGDIMNRISLTENINIINANATASMSNPTYLKWIEYLPQETMRISNKVDQYLERYVGVIEPEIFEAVHKFKDSAAFSSSGLMSIPHMNMTCRILADMTKHLDRIALTARADAETAKFFTKLRPDQMRPIAK